MISEKQLAAYERAYIEATPGNWYVVRPPWGDGDYVVAGNPDPQVARFVASTDHTWGDPDAEDEGLVDYTVSDAVFIETARNTWPRLLATVRRQQRALQSIANSSCCGCCQEAALVARASLNESQDALSESPESPGAQADH